MAKPSFPVDESEEVTVVVPELAGPTMFDIAIPVPAKGASPGIHSALHEVFLRTVELDGARSVEDAMEFVLDLALYKVPASTGAVLLSTGRGLRLVAARGPRAREVVSTRMILPLKQGVTGASASLGISALVNDVSSDARYSKPSDAQLDDVVSAVVCAPLVAEGRTLGCLRLTQRHGGFTEPELGVLEYLASQATRVLVRLTV